MYDTIGMHLITDNSEEVVNLLSNVDTKIKSTGEYYSYGNVENMRIGVYPTSIQLEGSLSKYLHGNNIEQFTRQDTKRSIEKLSDALQIPVKAATVRRIDFAYNFKMKQQVSEYISLLGETRYLEKRPWNKTGIYYSNTRRSLIFYDKLKEYQEKKKTHIVPKEFTNTNLLRYEIRFMKYINRQFKSKVKAADLYNESFYDNVTHRWKDSYFMIEKAKRLRMDIENVQGTKNLDIQLSIIGLNVLGGKQVLIDMYKNQKTMGKLDRFKYNRLKNRINQISNSPKHFEPNDFILELDGKVKQVA